MKSFTTLVTLSLLLSTSVFISCEGEDIALSPTTSSTNGTNSSYARILTVGSYIYAVNLTELITFDAQDPSNPTEIDRQDIGIGIETLFHHNGILLVGSSEGTYTYLLESTGIPTRKGQFDYSTLVSQEGFSIPITFCDPVVASGDVAYATVYTLQSIRTVCGREEEISLLVVMDISDLENPTLITTRRTSSPRGLAVEGDYLYVCNEREGLSVYDVSNPSRPNLVSTVFGITAYDVVVKDGILIVVGGSELIQFDYSNPEELVRLSTIEMT